MLGTTLGTFYTPISSRKKSVFPTWDYWIQNKTKTYTYRPSLQKSAHTSPIFNILNSSLLHIGFFSILITFTNNFLSLLIFIPMSSHLLFYVTIYL